VLEIALAPRQEVVLATDGYRGPRDGEEEEMEERGMGPLPSKEAMDKFTPFGESKFEVCRNEADHQIFCSTRMNTSLPCRRTSISA